MFIQGTLTARGFRIRGYTLESRNCEARLPRASSTPPLSSLSSGAVSAWSGEAAAGARMAGASSSRAGSMVARGGGDTLAGAEAELHIYPAR